MSIKIALAGNPNSGKTTLFNALTGSNQFVGNWPGVTVEKKEGKLKGNKDVVIMDLPGIYSLSPYTLEEVVSRNYLITERPDAILNIVDGTNIERNLYLTTQLLELGIPVVIAVNMMDVVNKNGDKIDIKKLSSALGCEVVTISALKGTGITDAAQRAVSAANAKTKMKSVHKFDGAVEAALEKIESRLGADIPEEQKRFFAVKLFERDAKIAERMKTVPAVDSVIEEVENAMDDDAESIITNERYVYISSVIKSCYTKNSKGKLTPSDKIDRIVTNRWLALPIFAVVMFLVYYISVTTVGTWATDWANDGVFGDGFHFLGIGSSAYEEVLGEFEKADAIVGAFEEAAEENGVDPAEAVDLKATAYLYDEDGEVSETIPVDFAIYNAAAEVEEPDPADYGAWVPGIPVLVESGLEKLGTADWLNGLILDGIVGGVGAVLGFVPQMLVLFLFLAFLEACGYMARIAFIMDRIFRKFGLSGKSFIPILIGTGCGVPGIMASRTIENERDRRMTIMTTTFIPCGAKLPIIALIAGALFNGAWWVAPSAYFVGIVAIVTSGIILKKSRIFAGDPAPFVMELPAYHMPTVGNVLRSMWERGWSFIKKAGTIILLSAIVVWFLMSFGFVDGKFVMVEDLNDGFLSVIGGAIAWIFAPLGWGHWQAAVAAITGLVAKENVVGTFGVLYGFAEVAEDGAEIWGTLASSFSGAAAYSFLVFNLLCAPCFAAIGAIKREMNSAKWTWIAIGYQTVLAYAVALCVYQFTLLFTAGSFGFGTAAALLVFAGFLFLLFRPAKKHDLRNKKSKSLKA
ncbi:MAG: ferrous iron transporter B [Oscillospiraceae bacterium]|jgi:ferrous iron transport protein B|nr:ferrous iron transporter B [Oscillospiraceae bacterium]